MLTTYKIINGGVIFFDGEENVGWLPARDLNAAPADVLRLLRFMPACCRDAALIARDELIESGVIAG